MRTTHRFLRWSLVLLTAAAATAGLVLPRAATTVSHRTARAISAVGSDVAALGHHGHHALIAVRPHPPATVDAVPAPAAALWGLASVVAAFVVVRGRRVSRPAGAVHSRAPPRGR